MEGAMSLPVRLHLRPSQAAQQLLPRAGSGENNVKIDSMHRRLVSPTLPAGSAYAQRDQSTLKIHYVPSDMHKNIAQYEEFRRFLEEELD
jgi:hypothetical protein